MKKPITRLDYCQYWLVSQLNYTLTHFAQHSEIFSHDAINRYLQSERLTPRLVWDNTAPQILPTAILSALSVLGAFLQSFLLLSILVHFNIIHPVIIVCPVVRKELEKRYLELIQDNDA